MRLTKRTLKRIIREEYSRLKRRGLIREAAVWQFNPEMGEDGQDCEEGTSIKDCAATWVEYIADSYGDEMVRTLARDLVDGESVEWASNQDQEEGYAIGECLEGMDIRGSGNWDRREAAKALAIALRYSPQNMNR